MKNQNDKTAAAFFYSVSYEPYFLQYYFKVPIPALDALKASYEKIEKNPEAAIRDLIKFSKKFPAVPQFKNILTIAYQSARQPRKADEVTEQLVREHPDYLFGRINKAYLYLHENKPELVPDILGKFLEIRGLYPERDLFHISEVMAFNKVVALYYMAIGNREVAESYLLVMEKFDKDHPDAKSLRKEIFELKLGALLAGSMKR